MRTIICISLFIFIEPALLTYVLTQCGRDADCKYEGLYCLKNECNCKPPTRYTGKNDPLGKAECENVYGANCITKEECKNMNNTECSQNNCVCAEGFKLDSIGNTCIRVSKPNEFCESASNCISVMGSQSECMENKCICKPNHHLNKDNFCIKSAMLHEPCDSDECYVLNNRSNVLRCLEHKCVCKEGFTELNRQCNEREITETITYPSSKNEPVYSTTGGNVNGVTSQQINQDIALRKEGSASSIEKTWTLMIICASYIIFLRL